MRLDQHTHAVVTGAGSGIGAALARALDARGASVSVCDVQGERLDALCDTLRGDPLCATVDVSDAEAVGAFAERVVDERGVPDLVVANAGVALTGDFVSGHAEEWDWIVGVNLWGVVHTTRAFLPAMVDRGSGWVANISSVFGLIGVPNYSAYCATKAAVRGFTESLDVELRDTGVGVTCIHPGAVATRIAEDGRVGRRVFGRVDPGRGKKLIARGLPPDDAAQIMLRGIERKKRRVLVGRDAWLLDKVQRIAPVRYRTLMKWVVG